MSILDTLPELPPLRPGPGSFIDDQLRERDRIVAEHVVRMCAEVCRTEAADFARSGDGCRDGRYDHRADGAETCHDAILALLEPVGINGLTRTEETATASVRGLLNPKETP